MPAQVCPIVMVRPFLTPFLTPVLTLVSTRRDDLGTIEVNPGWQKCGADT